MGIMAPLDWALKFLTTMPSKRPNLFYALIIYGLYRWYKRAQRAKYDREYVISVTEDGKTVEDIKFEVVGVDADPPLESVPTLVAEMRRSFQTGISRPYRKRLEQLQAVRRMLVENEEAFYEALRSDLGRPKFESLVYDLKIPLLEVEEMIRHLRDWMRPDSAPMNLLTFPSEDLVYKEPYGTALVIGTWNYPIMLSLIPMAGAIAAGNTCIVKPSNVSPATAKLVGELIGKYMDPRIVSCVGPGIRGDRHTIQALIAEKFDYIFFTGGVSVGKMVAAAAAKNLTPTTLELGGKNPVFVAKDADVALAAKRILWGRMMNAGQQCIAPDYVLLHRDVQDRFFAECKRYIGEFYEGKQKEPGVVGRIVNDRHVARLQEMIEQCKASGGSFVVGGEVDASQRYFEPSVLHTPIDSPAMADETFGPILMAVTVDSMDEAIRYVNQRAKPLSLYVFSESKATQERIIQNTSSGGVTVNGTLFHVGHPGLPFGGVGDSGTGAYHGKETFNAFSHRRAVLRKTKLPDGGLVSDLAVLYPPWGPWKIKAMELLSKLL